MIEKKLEELEREIKTLKSLMLLERDELFEKELVSLRGMGKLIVSEEELDEAIKKAKKSLFNENAVRY
jgi:hypothetical protein